MNVIEIEIRVPETVKAEFTQLTQEPNSAEHLSELFSAAERAINSGTRTIHQDTVNALISLALKTLETSEQDAWKFREAAFAYCEMLTDRNPGNTAFQKLRLQTMDMLQATRDAIIRIENSFSAPVPTLAP